jgi:hypothetical protein
MGDPVGIAEIVAKSGPLTVVRDQATGSLAVAACPQIHHLDPTVWRNLTTKPQVTIVREHGAGMVTIEQIMDGQTILAMNLKNIGQPNDYPWGKWALASPAPGKPWYVKTEEFATSIFYGLVFIIAIIAVIIRRKQTLDTEVDSEAKEKIGWIRRFWRATIGGVMGIGPDSFKTIQQEGDRTKNEVGK